MPSEEGDEIDETTAEGKKVAAAKKRNATAMACLTIAFTSEANMCLVYEAVTSEWPSGLAHQVVSALFKKYQPQDTMTKVELRQQLNKISMKGTDDPMKLFEQISAIKNRYNTATKKIEEEDLIATVLEKAPKEYQALLTSEQLRLGDSLALEDLRKAMTTHWRTVSDTTANVGTNVDGEISLSSFGGFCFNCKEKGHKAHQCPKKNSGKPKPKKFKGKCNHCGKEGHKYADCWQREENKDKRPKNFKPANPEVANAGIDSGVQVELCFCGITFPDDVKILYDPNIWIADSGNTADNTGHKEGIEVTRKGSAADATIIGDGKAIKAEVVGKLRGTICNKFGEEIQPATLNNVKYVPDGRFNLFSLTKRMRVGWKLSGDKDAIKLTSPDGKQNVVFDIKVNTTEGVIYCMYLRRTLPEVAAANVQMPVKMNIVQAHAKFGHCDEAATRQAAKILGIELVKGTLPPCEACAAAKAKQKNVPKSSDHRVADADAGRIFLDIATVKGPKGVTLNNPNWLIKVDERTQLKYSEFYKSKNGMVEPTCEQFEKWRQAGYPVKFVRCDNAGENILLEKRCKSKDWKLNIEFEFTARNTPQQNHLAELGFAILANRGRALMHYANIPTAMRYKLFREAFKTATLLDGLMVINIDGKLATRYMHKYGSDPAYAKHLRTWGEAGTVTLKGTFPGKLADRGVQCMMVGYALQHTGDTYRMWDPNTNRIHTTRDIIWLKRMFYPKIIRPEVSTGVDNEAGEGLEVRIESSGEGVESNDKDDSEEANNENEDANENTVYESGIEPEAQEAESTEVDDDEEAVEPLDEAAPVVTRSGRIVRPPSRYKEDLGAIAMSYEIGLTDAEREYYTTMKEIGEMAFVGAGIGGQGFETAFVGAGLGGGFENTSELHVMKYKEAMATKDAESWKKAVEEEHERMMKHNVWKPVPRVEVPKEATTITSTWAMKKKANGTYRARLNARGFQQIDGVHYDGQTISSPVANDATIRIVLIIMIMAGWVGELLDVKGAFLHGDFEDDDEVYMEVPEGFEKYYDPRIYVLLLLQTLYGLKQAALAFWKKLLQCFKSMGFDRSKADPCLYFKWTIGGLVLWLSWVDDCLAVGSLDNVNKAKKQMTDRFDCDVIGNMDEYVGCKVEYNRRERWIKLTQPVLLQSFKDEFELPESVPSTPAEPGQMLLSGDEESPLKASDQKTYRKGVGKLLHMMRWSRPDILNSVRELSKYMTKATPAHLKAMYRVMAYCVGTEKRGLLLKPEGQWDGNPDYEFEIFGLSDSNYATDPMTRRSISGCATFLNKAPVIMRSKQQGSTKLSTTEAELDAGTTTAQDMLFSMRVVESVGLKVKKPMILMIDNKGTVDLINNWSVGGRTRHVEVRMYFLRELKEQGIIRTVWCPSERMSADMFTKNLPPTLFRKHATAFCGQDEYS